MGRGTRLSRKNPILKKSCFFFFKRNRLCGPRSLWQQIPRQGNKQSYPLPCIMHSTFSTSLIKRLEEEDDDGGWKGKRNLTDGELERLDQSEEWRKPKRCFFLARGKKKLTGWRIQQETVPLSSRLRSYRLPHPIQMHIYINTHSPLSIRFYSAVLVRACWIPASDVAIW